MNGGGGKKRVGFPSPFCYPWRGMGLLDQRIAAKEREGIDLPQRLGKAKLGVPRVQKAAALRPSGVDGMITDERGGTLTIFQSKASPALSIPPHLSSMLEKLGSNGRRTGGGRKNGDISKQWRSTLGEMAKRGNEPKLPI